MLSERLTTLSPLRADTGMIVRSGTSSFVANAANSFSIRLKTASS